MIEPILIGALVAFILCGAFYFRFVRREELRHLAEERDIEHRHADDWKDLATALADGALIMREAPTIEEAKLHAEMLHKGEDGEEREETLEELEAQLQTHSDPLKVSMDGELGDRRALVAKIARMRASRDSGLSEPSEPLTEHVVNSLDGTDMRHLEGKPS